MWKYIIKRILIAIPVLIGITMIEYGLMSLAGNPLDMIQGAHVSEAAKALKSEELGLNKPVVIQYLDWVGQILRGNLGTSISQHVSVSKLIGSHVGPTLLLMGTALLISILITVPVGIFSATHQYKKSDYTIVGFSFLGMSIPGFFLALVLIYFFSVRLQWLPSSGMMTLGAKTSIIDMIRHMILPVIVLVVSMTGTNLRYIRSAMLEILQEDYLRTAKAKGIGQFKVVYKHALRNALIPVITVFGMQIPILFGGAIIVEEIFSWPGLGLLTMSAIISRDYPVIMGVSLISAIVVLAANLITDILYAIADPSIQYQ